MIKWFNIEQQLLEKSLPMMPNPHTLDVDALINILYRVVYYVLDQHFLYIILHRAFANIFYVIFIPEGRAKAAVGGQFASYLNYLLFFIILALWGYSCTFWH